MPVNKKKNPRLRNLEYLLRTKTDPDGIRRSKTIVRWLGLVTGLVLILGPVLYFRELGDVRYIIGFSAALGGALLFWGEVNKSATEQLEDFHDCIDFDKVKLKIDREGTDKLGDSE